MDPKNRPLLPIFIGWAGVKGGRVRHTLHTYDYHQATGNLLDGMLNGAPPVPLSQSRVRLMTHESMEIGGQQVNRWDNNNKNIIFDTPPKPYCQLVD